MKNLELARKVRGLAVQHLTVTELRIHTKSVLNNGVQKEEFLEVEEFLLNCELTHGLGMEGALELLCKISTFVAIAELELEQETP